MGILADKLSYLDGTKTAIKNAIIAKGVEVKDTDTFRDYADKIGEIESGGIPEYERYSIVDEGATSVPTMPNAHYWFMSKVYIPSSVTQVGNYFVARSVITEASGGGFGLTFGTYAFVSCTSLATIDLPSVTQFGASAFQGCTSLATIDLPSATTFGANAFVSCTLLTAVDLPSATTFGTDAFYKCTSLTTIDLLSATTFGDFAFCDCTSIATVDLPSATTFGDFAFCDCTSIATVDLPSATTFGNSAFANCTSLAIIDLPSATTFGASAFQGCTSLATVDLPSATTFGASAFQGCTALANIDLGSRSNVLTLTIGLYLQSDSLTVDSFLQVGNALAQNPPGTKTIYVKTVAWNRLSTAQKAIFTNKNYTISVS